MMLAEIVRRESVKFGDSLEHIINFTSEITVYKAMGIAMEDMVAANLAFERANQGGVGAYIVL